MKKKMRKGIMLKVGNKLSSTKGRVGVYAQKFRLELTHTGDLQVRSSQHQKTIKLFTENETLYSVIQELAHEKGLKPHKIMEVI